MPPTDLSFAHSQTAQFAQAASMWAPAQERACILGWLSWGAELAHTKYQVSDPHIAQTKLLWWQSELARAYAGHAEHPQLKRLMAQARASERPALELGIKHIQAWQQDLQQSRHLDEMSLITHLQDSAGTLVMYALGWSKNIAPEVQVYAREAATALRLAALLRLWGRDAAHGMLYIPISDLQRFDIKAHLLLQRAPDLLTSSAYQALMQHQLNRFRRKKQEALDLQPSRLPVHCSVLPIWMDLEMHLLENIAQQGFNVLHQHIQLTPLQIQWHAQKSRWRWRNILQKD